MKKLFTGFIVVFLIAGTLVLLPDRIELRKEITVEANVQTLLTQLQNVENGHWKKWIADHGEILWNSEHENEKGGWTIDFNWKTKALVPDSLTCQFYLIPTEEGSRVVWQTHLKAHGFLDRLRLNQLKKKISQNIEEGLLVVKNDLESPKVFTNR